MPDLKISQLSAVASLLDTDEFVLNSSGTNRKITGLLLFPRDGAVAAATRVMANKLLAADAQPAFRIMGDGKHEWGAGGAGAIDANLYRAAANVLKTDYGMNATRGFNAAGMAAAGSSAYQAGVTGDSSSRLVVRADGMISWGPGNAAVDTNLYRDTVNRLRSDSPFYVPTMRLLSSTLSPLIDIQDAQAVTTVVLDSRVTGAGSQYMFVLTADGKHQWGPGGAVAPDTTLYRAAAGVVKTDGAIATLSYGTSLPASPVDGQEYTLVDSTTAPNYAWRLRYNAGSASAYKWEFVGGSDFYSPLLAGGQVGVPANTPKKMGDLLTLPRAGDYNVEFGAMMLNTTAATEDQNTASIRRNDAVITVASGAASIISYELGSASNFHGSTSFGRFRVNGCAANDVLNAWANSLLATGYVQNIYAVVRPYRVS